MKNYIVFNSSMVICRSFFLKWKNVVFQFHLWESKIKETEQ